MARHPGFPLDGKQVTTVNTMKRIVVGVFASAVVLVPLSAPATAAPAEKTQTVKVTKAKPGVSIQRAIDWE